MAAQTTKKDIPAPKPTLDEKIKARVAADTKQKIARLCDSNQRYLTEVDLEIAKSVLGDVVDEFATALEKLSEATGIKLQRPNA